MQYRKTRDGIVVSMINRGEEYQQYAKEYAINMCRNTKMLHRKNVCHDSKCLYEFISYDTKDEVRKLPFVVSQCQKCFPNQDLYTNVVDDENGR